jgi:NADPH:quinone reductase-like Zn-dependent oxidoreductase
LTAYQALVRRLHVKSGQSILVQAGAGGVGGFAIQIAVQAGASVITTASAANHDYVRSLGAEAAIDYRHEQVHERVMAWSGGRGVDAVVDTVSGASATAGTRMLAFGGAIACIAGLPDFAQVSFQKAISIHQIALGGAYFQGDRRDQADLAHMGEEMIAMVADGRIDPLVSEVIDFEDIPSGLEELRGRHVHGKIVAQIIR